MTRNLDIYEKEVDLHSLGRKKRLMQNTTGIFEFVNDFFFFKRQQSLLCNFATQNKKVMVYNSARLFLVRKKFPAR